ncbi:Wadjet anti-phage system protein JetD domain-containing protein [Pseudomonas sp. BGr12]|uniref:Wadjet anti-phage system protein JetD domain-containing protein n=1 Tax=Pseudomonas sp. BGr12 TaxID=2936269 RepID=UPI0025595FC8|nr:Wadjet anti-phage system protein JetD domain-containing protein [Pseudomonas sp. BJa5]MDL2428464.1 DUF2220 family protein [Pseudomonas sp. BJa5]
MSELFFERLDRNRAKKVDLVMLRSLWLDAHPEQLETHDRDHRLLDALKKGQELGLLKLPAPGSFEKFGRPPMPTFVTLARERKQKPSVDYTKVAWVPELGFWPSLSLVELATAALINEWLIARRGRFLTVPLRERSLEIFGDEKYLDSRVRGDALFAGKLSLSSIGAMRVEHPLAYRPADARGKPVLVVENHHTFWSLGEWNQQAKEYSAIVFGSGNTLCASGMALSEVMRERGAISAEYFGDLDPEGVSIPLKFNRMNIQQLMPCCRLYRALLEVGVRRKGGEPQASHLALAASWLPELADQIAQMWDEGMWMPQEAVGFERLTGLC